MKSMYDELTKKELYGFDDLCYIMSILRGDNGCPWDKEQTHMSIRKNLIEETYEVVEAIDNDDTALMREELGDLMLQVVFHARMSEEEGRFDINDVCNEICHKLIVRHPHIFADAEGGTAEQVLGNWEKIKAETKKDKRRSALDGIPPSMPALMKASKSVKKAVKAGVKADYRILSSDIAENAEKLKKGFDANTAIRMIFALASMLWLNGIDAEEGLDGGIKSFSDLFRKNESDNSLSNGTLCDYFPKNNCE